MKTFKDLVFKKDRCNLLHAIITFPNGYGLSAILDKNYDSNGIDTFEIAILKNGDVCYECLGILQNDGEGIEGWATKDRITDVMKKVQLL